MRRIFIFLLSILMLCPFHARLNVLANSHKYARAIDSSINLYKFSTDDNSIDNVLCLVEKSYFVEIISDNVENYKVRYNGIIGYVKKNDVVLVSNVPTTPFPTGIKLTIGSNCNLRSTPSTKTATSNIISTIYSGETNIEFIGRVFAEETIDFGGTTWYYVIYNGEKGYIYNKYVKAITPIYNNQEETYLQQEETFTQVNPIDNPSSIAIMIILFLPCLCILFLLYYPRKRHIRKSSDKRVKIIERY